MTIFTHPYVHHVCTAQEHPVHFPPSSDCAHSSSASLLHPATPSHIDTGVRPCCKPLHSLTPSHCQCMCLLQAQQALRHPPPRSSLPGSQRLLTTDSETNNQFVCACMLVCLFVSIHGCFSLAAPHHLLMEENGRTFIDAPLENLTGPLTTRERASSRLGSDPGGM